MPPTRVQGDIASHTLSLLDEAQPLQPACRMVTQVKVDIIHFLSLLLLF